MGTIWSSFRGCASLAPAVPCTRSLRRSGTGGGKDILCRNDACVKNYSLKWDTISSIYQYNEYSTISYDVYSYGAKWQCRAAITLASSCLMEAANRIELSATAVENIADCQVTFLNLFFVNIVLPQKVQGDWSVGYPATCSPFCTDHTEPSLFASLVATPWHCALCVSVSVSYRNISKLFSKVFWILWISIRAMKAAVWGVLAICW